MEALRARIETLEAQLQAEQKQREAAEAKSAAYQAQFREHQINERNKEHNPQDYIIRPAHAWPVMMVVAMSTLSCLYLGMQWSHQWHQSQGLKRVVQHYQNGYIVNRFTRCPHQHRYQHVINPYTSKKYSQIFSDKKTNKEEMHKQIRSAIAKKQKRAMRQCITSDKSIEKGNLSFIGRLRFRENGSVRAVEIRGNDVKKIPSRAKYCIEAHLKTIVVHNPSKRAFSFSQPITIINK